MRIKRVALILGETGQRGGRWGSTHIFFFKYSQIKLSILRYKLITTSDKGKEQLNYVTPRLLPCQFVPDNIKQASKQQSGLIMTSNVIFFKPEKVYHCKMQMDLKMYV